jgi:hypothetical protein
MLVRLFEAMRKGGPGGKDIIGATITVIVIYWNLLVRARSSPFWQDASSSRERKMHSGNFIRKH